MEEKKLGMGWYEFQRYFIYGFGRIPILLLAGFMFIVALSAMEISLFFAAAIIFADFLFTFIVHRHLENYSDKAGAFITYPYLAFGILGLINILLSLFVAPENFGDQLSTASVNFFWFFVNRLYYKNRAHIFVTKCNFFGKKTEVPIEKTEEFKFCRICGRKLDINDKFCPGCGTKVIETEEK